MSGLLDMCLLASTRFKPKGTFWKRLPVFLKTKLEFELSSERDGVGMQNCTDGTTHL